MSDDNAPDLNDLCDDCVRRGAMCGMKLPVEAFVVWCENFQITEPDHADFKRAFNAYRGKYDSHAHYAYEFLNDIGDYQKVPEYLQAHLDLDSYTRDCIIGGDLWESDGYYFNNHD